MYPFYYFQVNPRHHIIPFQYVSVKDKRLFFPKYTYFKFLTLTLDIDLILSMWLLKRGEREKKKVNLIIHSHCFLEIKGRS